MSGAPQYVQADISDYPVWKLPANAIWNVPDSGDVRFEIETRGPWPVISRVRGLAVTKDGRVWGVRSLQYPRESGYAMEGRVSIGGRTYRAFTDSQLFERPDGSLCNVAILYVCVPDDDAAPAPAPELGAR